MAGEQMDEVNREFDSLVASLSRFLNDRLRTGFQINTIREGTTFYGSRPYFAPGSYPNQTGPSAATVGINPSPSIIGESAPMPLEMMDLIGGAPPVSPTANPESVPPTGPEESIRYSCTDGKCIQDPNGQYYGIEECQESGCAVGPGQDPDGDLGQGLGGSGLALSTFKARITGITCTALGLVSGTKTYWTYSWEEVLPPGWPELPKTSIQWGDALNEYELSIENDGANVVPATATLDRLRIPTDAVVEMNLDQLGDPWFVQENPLEVVCT